MGALFYYTEAGQIVLGPVQLPRNWRNISGFADESGNTGLPYSVLASHGWLPEARTGFEPFDPKMQTRSGPVLTVGSSDVTAAYTVADKSLGDMRAVRIQETKDHADFRLGAQYTRLDQVWGMARGTIQLNNGSTVSNAIVTGLQWIDTLRTRRETLITAIGSMQSSALKSMSVADSSNWST